MIKAIPVAAPVTVASAAVNDAASTIASQRHTGRAGIASIKPSKSKSKFKSPDPQSNLLNSDGIEYCNRNGSSTSTGTRNVHLQYNHQETILKTPATRSKQQSVYYSARPSREAVLQRLSEALLRRSLRKIDLSQRSLQASDARLVKMALAQNANLTVLKLGYNNLGDAGVKTLVAGICCPQVSQSVGSWIQLSGSSIQSNAVPTVADRSERNATSNEPRLLPGVEIPRAQQQPSQHVRNKRHSIAARTQ